MQNEVNLPCILAYFEFLSHWFFCGVCAYQEKYVSLSPSCCGGRMGNHVVMGIEPVSSHVKKVWFQAIFVILLLYPWKWHAFWSVLPLSQKDVVVVQDIPTAFQIITVNGSWSTGLFSHYNIFRLPFIRNLHSYTL
jgi:hypothetical protein